MKVNFALDYIPKRMRELSFGDNYIMRWRHLQIDSESTIHIDANNEYYFLIEPERGIVVKSKTGVFNVLDSAINELQYEHRGKIEVDNLNTETKLVLFIQVIPNHF